MKQILKLLLTLALYELSKEITYEIIIRLTDNDDIDGPCDYEVNEWCLMIILEIWQQS